MDAKWRHAEQLFSFFHFPSHGALSLSPPFLEGRTKAWRCEMLERTTHTQTNTINTDPVNNSSSSSDRKHAAMATATPSARRVLTQTHINRIKKKETMKLYLSVSGFWIRARACVCLCARVCVVLLRDALATVQMISAVILKGKRQPERTVGPTSCFKTTDTSLNEQPR